MRFWKRNFYPAITLFLLVGLNTHYIFLPLTCMSISQYYIIMHFLKAKNIFNIKYRVNAILKNIPHTGEKESLNQCGSKLHIHYTSQLITWKGDITQKLRLYERIGQGPILWKSLFNSDNSIEEGGGGGCNIVILITWCLTGYKNNDDMSQHL